MNIRRHVGGSLLPSNNQQILTPVKTSHGTLQVRVITEQDTHGLFDTDSNELLAQHPNGFSCHDLAVRLRDRRRPAEQAAYIVACGGLVTAAGHALISKHYESNHG